MRRASSERNPSLSRSRTASMAASVMSSTNWSHFSPPYTPLPPALLQRGQQAAQLVVQLAVGHGKTAPFGKMIEKNRPEALRTSGLLAL